MRFEPGPFSAWVQHANHSATEPPLSQCSVILYWYYIGVLTVCLFLKWPVLCSCDAKYCLLTVQICCIFTMHWKPELLGTPLACDRCRDVQCREYWDYSFMTVQCTGWPMWASTVAKNGRILLEQSNAHMCLFVAFTAFLLGRRVPQKGVSYTVTAQYILDYSWKLIFLLEVTHAAGIRKVKPIWILLNQEWQWHQLGHMQVCTSLQTDNHASTPPLSFLQAICPSCRPTNSVKALNVVTL